MRQFFAVLKLQLDNTFTLFRSKDVKKVILNVLKTLLIFGIIFGGCWFIISRITFFLILKYNQSFFAIILTLLLVISLVFSTSNVIRTMFVSKENQLLLCLPAKFDHLYLSKLVILYLKELIFNVLYVLPIMLAFGVCGVGVPWTYYIVIILLFPIFPLATLGIASLIAIPVMYVVKFLKNRPNFTVILALVFIAVVFVFYMMFVNSISGAFNIAEQQSKTSQSVNNAIFTIGRKIPIIYWLSAIFVDIKKIYRLYIFMVAFLGVFALAMFLIKPTFFKVAIFANEEKQTTSVKRRRYKKRSPVKELFVNEFRTTLRSPSIVLQYFLFPILMPLIVYTYDHLLFSITVQETGHALIFASHVLVLFMIVTLSSVVSSTALSREGGMLYIAKLIPVKYKTQAAVKIGFNLLISWSAIIVTTIICCIFNDTKIGLILMASIASLFLSFGHICHCFDIDLRRPALNWYDISEISNLSKNTTEGILYGFLLAGVFAVLAFASGESVWLAAILLIIPAALYALGRFILLKVRLRFYFRGIEI